MVNFLSLIIALPFIGAFLLLLVNSQRPNLLRAIALSASSFTLISIVNLFVFFDTSSTKFQFVETGTWIEKFNVSYTFGIDGISLLFIALTALIFFILFLNVKKKTQNIRGYLIALLILETAILGAFASLDLVCFYLFWELMLIPLYFIIGIWGDENRYRATMQFMIYTLLGSLLMLVSIIYLGFQHNEQFGVYSFLFSDLMKLHLSFDQGLLVFLSFVVAFAIKIPLIPFHSWQTTIYSSAPIAGTIVLASLISKLGIYALIRFTIPIFPEQTIYFAPVFFGIALTGVIFGALMAWLQDNIKLMLTYFSLSQLSFCMLGYCALNIEGTIGAIFQMVNHGIIITGLFILTGIFYERIGSSNISSVSGLAKQMPRFSAVLFIFILAAIALPLTNGFIGEFVILLAVVKRFSFWGAIAVVGMILSAVYMLSFYRRICFGLPRRCELNSQSSNVIKKSNSLGDNEISTVPLRDLRLKEFFVLLPLIILIFLIGIQPQLFIRFISVSVQMYIGGFM